MLGIMGFGDKFFWLEKVFVLVYAYNCIRFVVIGYSLFFLMFGRRFNLLIDI